MFFLAPLMLIGAAAVAVPIAIHLMDRSKSVAIDWPTLRFLKIARQQSARRSKIKNWLVLLARCLILLLIAAAMAKPYKMAEEWNERPDLPRTVVIVLDNSYSMGYRENPAIPAGGDGAASGGDETGTRFARAKELALRQVRELGEHDEVAVVLVNEQAVALLDRPTRDRSQAEKLITEAKLTDRGTNMEPALTTAFAVGNLDAIVTAPAGGEDGETASGAAAPKSASKEASTGRASGGGGGGAVRQANREVMVFTDLQASAWREAVEQKIFEKVAAPLPLTVVDLSATGTANRFVRQVRVRDETAGGMLGVEAEFAGQAGRSGTGEQVQLWIDGQKAGAPEAISISSNKVTLRAPLPAPGVHICSVSIDSDALPIDDKSYFAINVTGGSKVTIVDGDPSALPQMSETFFLNAALSLAGGKGNAPTVEKLTAAELSSASLKGGGTILLCNVPRLDGSALNKVENFLRSGGSVFVSLGDKVDLSHYNTDWHFLPIALDKRMGDASRSRAYAVMVEQADHPLFGGGALDLSATRYFAFVGSDPTKLRNSGKVIASFSNGSPYLVEGTFGGSVAEGASGGAAGGGRVLLMTGPLDADWSNLPYRRAFVPFVDRLISHLTRQRMSSRAVSLGQPVKFTGPGTLDRKPIAITAPDGTTQTLTAELDSKTGQVGAEYRDTQWVGVYRVQADEAFATGGAFAVNLDTKESVLTPYEKAEMEKAFSKGKFRIVTGAATGVAAWKQDDSPELQQRRTEIWPWLLLAAFFVFIAETVLANVFTRRRRAEAPPTTEYMGTRRGDAVGGGAATAAVAEPELAGR